MQLFRRVRPYGVLLTLLRRSQRSMEVWHKSSAVHQTTIARANPPHVQFLYCAFYALFPFSAIQVQTRFALN